MLTFLLELIKIVPSVVMLIVEYFKRKPTPSPIPVPEPPKPEPVPEPVPVPDDTATVPEESFYLRLSRAKELADQLEIDLQENAWAGWRDPDYVASYCPDVAPLPASDVLKKFADEGAELDVEGAGILTRLELEHSKHPGRSVVRKVVWVEFNTRLQDHLDYARDLRNLVKNEPGAGVSYDSIKGWCEYKRKGV